jgi:hypothetical protein
MLNTESSAGHGRRRCWVERLRLESSSGQCKQIHRVRATIAQESGPVESSSPPSLVHRCSLPTRTIRRGSADFVGCAEHHSELRVTDRADEGRV